MKRYISIFLAAFLSLFLLGCEKEKETVTQKAASPADFLIMTIDGGIEEHTAKMIGAELETMGYTWDLEKKVPKALPKETKGVIFVGVEAEAVDKPTVRCSFNMNDSGENTLAPSLSSGTMARAATLLLPASRHFTVLSREAGGADVQDACDYFDLCGVDYSAKTLESGNLAAFLDASGSDAIILPSPELSGNGIELFCGDNAIFAVGEGEAVRGALATFCIDTELLSRDTAILAASIAMGKDAMLHTESYYMLCLNRTLCEKHSSDIPAVNEDFRVVVVD